MAEERMLFQGRIPFKVFHFSHGPLWLLFLGWNVGLIMSWVQWLGHSLQITSQRVVLTRGILSRTEEEVEYYRVRDTSVQQGTIQRLFGVGTMVLMSDDVTAPELRIPVHRPQVYQEQIRVHVREQRREMGALQVD